jgi:hypothetical protein
LLYVIRPDEHGYKFVVLPLMHHKFLLPF